MSATTDPHGAFVAAVFLAGCVPAALGGLLASALARFKRL